MPTDGIGEIIVAKNRHGSLDNVRLRFIKHLTRFDNLDSFDEPEFATTSFSPNKDFENSGADTITLGSKMNDDNDFLTNTNEEVPF